MEIRNDILEIANRLHTCLDYQANYCLKEVHYTDANTLVCTIEYVPPVNEMKENKPEIDSEAPF